MPGPSDLREHLRYYAELGVDGISRDPAWRQRPGASATSPGTEATNDAVPEPAPLVGEPPEPPEGSGAAATPETTPPLALAGASGAPRSAGRETLPMIRSDLGDCTRCKLHGGRTNLVFGVGNPSAELMFVGEGPGADEDIQGEPFVGRAGQLLTKIIEAMGFTRADVYIANVVKCRPPNNRNPEPDEILECEPFLIRQMEAIRPKVIVALGKFAAQSLLRSAEPISRLRGEFHAFRDARVMPTFHPSYLLRNPSAKREVWEDMKKVLAALGREVPRSGGSA